MKTEWFICTIACQLAVTNYGGMWCYGILHLNYGASFGATDHRTGTVGYEGDLR